MAEFIVNPAEATTPIDVVCGNANAEIIRFTFDRNSDGVDLADCAWAVTAKNSGGFSDTYMEGHGITNVSVSDTTISVDWALFGIAVGATGRTKYQLIGLQGKAIVKQFPYHTLNVLSYLESTLSTEAQEDMSQLWETIEYVGNQLPGILEAEAARKVAEAGRVNAENERVDSETARAAAEDAREQAEEDRAEAFDLIDLRVSKEGRITTLTATNADGTTTTAQVIDGKDGGAGEGTGDMLREIYDPDGDGVVAYADHATDASHATKADTATKADSATSADHAKDIPVPMAANNGMAIVVGPDGKYKLGEAGISEVSADIVKAGTFAGAVKANPEAVSDLAMAQVRNIACGTASVSEVISSLNVGDIYFTVEEAK